MERLCDNVDVCEPFDIQINTFRSLEENTPQVNISRNMKSLDYKD